MLSYFLCDLQKYNNFNVVAKKYTKHEIQRLSFKKGRKRDIDAVGRPFKLDLENRFLMLLVYYRLYIIYT